MEFMGRPAYGTEDIVLGISAAVASLALFLYPIPTIVRIVWRQSTGNLQPYPYLAMHIASAIWMLYPRPANGTFTFHDYCLFKVNSVGFIINSAYVYNFHMQSRGRDPYIIFATIIGEALLFAFLLILDYWVDAAPLITKAVGPAFIICGLIMYASPLPAIIDAYKRRRTETLPFGFCLMFSLNAIAWFSYAFFYPPTRDYYVAIAHGCGIVLGVGQLIFCFVFNVTLKNSGTTNEDSTPTEDSTPLLNDIP